MNTQPLIVALPIHSGDVEQAERLMKWIAELGNAGEHSLLVAADAGVPQERVKALLDVARPAFDSVRAMIVQTGVKGWPQAANLMFRAVARQVNQFYKLPWLWLEADAVPLRANWLEQISAAYRRCPRPLMGCVLNAERAIEGLPSRYLAGVAVYPQDLFGVLSDRWNDARFAAPTNPKLSTAQRQANVRAWDMIFADDLVPRAHHTPLIQQFWGTDYNMAPVFRGARTEADPINTVTLDMVKRDAVLFHRVKDVGGFLTLWRLRLEHEKALVVEAVHRETGEPSRDVDVALGAAETIGSDASAPTSYKGGAAKRKQAARTEPATV